MIDTLLRALDLRTGRFTSPHVERMNERICDRRRAADRRGVRPRVQRRRAVHPPGRRRPSTTRCRSSRPSSRWPTPRSPTRRSTWPWSRSGWAARGTPPTSPTAQVAVVHARSRSTTRATSATRRRRSRSRRPGSSSPARSPCWPSSSPAPAEVLLARVRRGRRERRSARGWSSASSSRVPAVGGQVLSLQGLRARYDDVFLPLYGAHQAQNAAVALAAVEAFLGDDEPLDDDLVREAFARATSPGRLEIVRRSPMILLDAAHNPHGAEAAAAALEDSFAFSPADRRRRRDGRQGRRGAARPPSSRTSPTSCAPRTPPTRAHARRRARRGGARGLRRRPRQHRAAARRRHRRGARRWPRPGEALGSSIGTGARARHRVRGHRRRGAGHAPATAGASSVSDERSGRRSAACARRSSRLEAVVARPDHAGDDQPRRRPLADRRLDRARAVRRLPAARGAAALGGGLRASAG